MLNNERKLQIIDLTVLIVLFVVACIIGKIVLNICDTWWAFSGPAIGIVLLGELLWMKVVRKKLFNESNC